MFFKKDPRRKAVKEAEDLLRCAEKVYCYRRDVMSESQRAELERAVGALNAAVSGPTTSVEEISEAGRRLDAILRQCGGTLYPVRFLPDNVETLLVAAILAIGIRTFLFQPFVIPTNSMYPTYSGMTSRIYQAGEAEPGTVERMKRLVQYGASHFEVRAPSAGPVMLPLAPLVKTPDGRMSFEGGVIRHRIVNGLRFGFWPTQFREYQVLVGEKLTTLRVPAEFNLDDVVAKAFFPEVQDLMEVVVKADRRGMIRASPDGQVFFLDTRRLAREGDRVLSFDILAGDWLFVDRVSYHFIRPELGDPIVFRTSQVPGLSLRDQYYIKRLVGEPGDVLQIQEPALYRNGEPIEGVDAFTLNAGRTGEYPGYRALGSLASPGSTVQVPPGNFFAMGDNSPYSHDSRMWGFVPERAVVGRALFIFYPFTHRWGPAE